MTTALWRPEGFRCPALTGIFPRERDTPGGEPTAATGVGPAQSRDPRLSEGVGTAGQGPRWSELPTLSVGLSPTMLESTISKHKELLHVLTVGKDKDLCAALHSTVGAGGKPPL